MRSLAALTASNSLMNQEFSAGKERSQPMKKRGLDAAEEKPTVFSNQTLVLSFADIKARFIEEFLPIKLPGGNLLNLSKWHDDDVSSYCIGLRILGAIILRDDLDQVQADEIVSLKNKNEGLLLNQFKIGLRKDLLKETGILLLVEPEEIPYMVTSW
ncbi:hypothetical protein JTB14_009954 [Gonioctena quinquepunctata]|nr:hypothetical protein JTB14_009954 [Gonioctena quinquepunctata]